MRSIGKFLLAVALLIPYAALCQAPTVPGLLTYVILNDTSTGTTVNKLAKLTSTGKAIVAATTDTDGTIGVVLSGAGRAGSVQIAVNGVVTCVFDGTATAGDYVQISSTVTGDCKDSGASSRPSSGQVIGRVVTGGTGVGSYLIALQTGSPAGSGSVSISGTPSAGQAAVWTNSTTIKGVVQPTVSTALNGGATTGTGGFVSGTYTTPAGVTWLEVTDMRGGGGGASGSGTSPGAGTTGGNTTFGSSLLVANGGSPGLANAAGGAGGSASGGYFNGTGQAGQAGSGGTNLPGGVGGSSLCGPGAGSAGIGNQGGTPAATNSGGGGGGAGDAATPNTGAGGGGGGCVNAIITSPSATYSYSVGTAGTGGSAGTSGQSGGAGGTGKIIIIEHYN